MIRVLRVNKDDKGVIRVTGGVGDNGSKGDEGDKGGAGDAGRVAGDRGLLGQRQVHPVLGGAVC